MTAEQLLKPCDLSGRTALVTGASSGLGAHFCKVLGQAGARVIACARRVDRLEKVVAEINDADGTAYAVAMDVANADSVARAFEQIDKIAGVVDILVNNAGIGTPHLFVKTTEADWDRLMETNLKSVWRVSRHCIDRMRAHDTGGQHHQHRFDFGFAAGHGTIALRDLKSRRRTADENHGARIGE